MRPKQAAVIFDLDGTLLDTIGDLADAGNHVLQTGGFPTHTESEYMQMVGDGIRELITRMLPEGERKPERVSETLIRMERFYELNWHHRTRLYPGIAELLDELDRRRSRVAVLSNKPHNFTVAMTDEFLGRWLLDPVIGAAPDRPRKPSPEPALAIARQWRIDPADCVIVGDSEPDIRTARAAGMISVAVSWGFRSGERLRLESPDCIIRSPDELPDVLERFGFRGSIPIDTERHPGPGTANENDRTPSIVFKKGIQESI